MNKLECIQVDYINLASRTLETVLLTNEKKQQKVVYLYNYEGVHFRIFDNIIEVSNFLSNRPYELLNEYFVERFADRFLEKYKFVS
ncbi:MAG: hypothetical protein WAT71_15790 [Ignavibacteria bacterium]